MHNEFCRAILSGSCSTYLRTLHAEIAQLVAREEVGATVDVPEGEIDRGRQVQGEVGDVREVERSRFTAKHGGRVHRRKSREKQNVQPHASSRWIRRQLQGAFTQAYISL